VKSVHYKLRSESGMLAAQPAPYPPSVELSKPCPPSVKIGLMRDTIVGNLEIQFSLKSKKLKIGLSNAYLGI
jgi:hypothetical protein